MKKFFQALGVACLACWPLLAAQDYLQLDRYSPQDFILQLAWAPARIFLDLILLDYAYALLAKKQAFKAWPWHLAPRALAIELTLTAQLAKRFMLGLLPLAALAAYLSGIDQLGLMRPLLWLLGPLGLSLLTLFVLRRLCAPLILLYQGLPALDCLGESLRLSQGRFRSVLLPLGLLSLAFGSFEEFGAGLGAYASWLLGPLSALGSAWALAWAYQKLLRQAKSA